MKTTMGVTKNTISILVVIVAAMNVALAETETEETISDIFAGMFKHHFAKDWSFAVGTKLWIHDWKTAFLDVEATSVGTDATLIPAVSLRYKNLFVTASHYLDTEFDFPEMTMVDLIPTGPDPDDFTEIVTTRRNSAGRLEWDAALGYFFHPYVALTAGYKFIEQRFTARDTFTSPLFPPETIISEDKTEISGPFVGLIATVPIGRGIGAYGTFSYGFLESVFFIGGVGELSENASSEPYILAEGGFTYTHTTDYLPAYMPLSSATVYTGYRYQDFDTELGFSDAVARDVTRGFVVGVNLSF